MRRLMSDDFVGSRRANEHWASDFQSLEALMLITQAQISRQASGCVDDT